MSVFYYVIDVIKMAALQHLLQAEQSAVAGAAGELPAGAWRDQDSAGADREVRKSIGRKYSFFSPQRCVGGAIHSR